jgi:hypothetical protein
MSNAVSKPVSNDQCRKSIFPSPASTRFACARQTARTQQLRPMKPGLGLADEAQLESVAWLARALQLRRKQPEPYKPQPYEPEPYEPGPRKPKPNKRWTYWFKSIAEQQGVYCRQLAFTACDIGVRQNAAIITSTQRLMPQNCRTNNPEKITDICIARCDRQRLRRPQNVVHARGISSATIRFQPQARRLRGGFPAWDGKRRARHLRRCSKNGRHISRRINGLDAWPRGWGPAV